MNNLLITAAEFEKQMKEIREEASRTRDIEQAHKKADQLMCETLKTVGYDAGVKIFEEMEKHYA